MEKGFNNGLSTRGPQARCPGVHKRREITHVLIGILIGGLVGCIVMGVVVFKGGR